MKNKEKIILYILLNVAITLFVFFIAYKWVEKKFITDFIPTTIPNIAATTQPTPTRISINIDLPSGDDVADMLDIVLVVGAGDPSTEQIQIKNTGEVSISLLGWSLQQNKQLIYQFPAIHLYPNSIIRVFTKAGTNTADQLYIGNIATIWHSGDTIILSDPAGNTQSSYLIP
jgi:hypothetical protein